MKQSPAVTTVKVSSLIGIAAVALTVLATILEKNVTWWLTIRPLLYQLVFLAAALWGWSPEGRDRYALLVAAIIRLLATVGAGLTSLLSLFGGVSLLRVGSLLQTAAAVLFLVGVLMYGKEKPRRE